MLFLFVFVLFARSFGFVGVEMSAKIWCAQVQRLFMYSLLFFLLRYQQITLSTHLNLDFFSLLSIHKDTHYG